MMMMIIIIIRNALLIIVEYCFLYQINTCILCMSWCLKSRNTVLLSLLFCSMFSFLFFSSSSGVNKDFNPFWVASCLYL